MSIMYFDNFAEFVDMGGHGVFVWSCYAIVLVTLVGNILQPIQAARKFQIALKRTLIHQADLAGPNVAEKNQNDKGINSSVTQSD
ncbi:MAG: heme exporter protein D [Candidatus Azotimanducaceae bacterium]